MGSNAGWIQALERASPIRKKIIGGIVGGVIGAAVMAAWIANDISDKSVGRKIDSSSLEAVAPSEAPLMTAVDHDDVALSARLIDSGADLHTRDDYGQTALHRVMREDRPGKKNYYNAHKISELLLSHGADVNAKDNDGNTALYDAVMGMPPEQIDLLLSHGADPNAQNNEGQTALHEAVKWANVEGVRLLLAHQADPDIRDHEGNTAMDLCLNGSIYREDAEIILPMLRTVSTQRARKRTTP